MCRENIRDFKPTFSKPVLKEYIIPTEYSVSVKKEKQKFVIYGNNFVRFFSFLF